MTHHENQCNQQILNLLLSLGIYIKALDDKFVASELINRMTVSYLSQFR